VPADLRKYVIRNIEGHGWGWAIIVIDTSNGFFSTVSDWGNYGYIWSAPGSRGFWQFLLEIDEHYLHGKLMSGRTDRLVYDEGLARRAVWFELLDWMRRKRKELRRLGRFQEEERRRLERSIEEEKEHWERADFSSSESFYAWSTESRLNFFELRDYHVPNRQCMAFCRRAWPRFCEMLRAELAAEAEAAAAPEVSA